MKKTNWCDVSYVRRINLLPSNLRNCENMDKVVRHERGAGVGANELKPKSEQVWSSVGSDSQPDRRTDSSPVLTVDRR